MSEIKDGGPAFPRPFTTAVEAAQGLGETGMSLRDWFAGMALHDHVCDVGYPLSVQETVRRSYELADAMLAEREAVKTHDGLIETLISLEARMSNSDPEGTCKAVVDAWLSDVRAAISRAEVPHG